VADSAPYHEDNLLQGDADYYDPINIVDSDENRFYGHDDVWGERAVRPALDLANNISDQRDYLILRDWSRNYKKYLLMVEKTVELHRLRWEFGQLCYLIGECLIVMGYMLEIPILYFIEVDFEYQRTEAAEEAISQEIRDRRAAIKEARRMRIYEALVEADKPKREAWLRNEKRKDDFCNRV
jgi:hypothetical protein